MGEQRAELQKTMGTFDVLCMAFGTMIGWGWIMLAGSWVADGGVAGAILAFAIGAVMCIFVGLTYAELTPALPATGGGLVFAYRGLGYTGGWITGWSMIFAYVGVAAWEGPALATAIQYIVPLPKIATLWTIEGFEVTGGFVLVGVIGGIIISGINFMGGHGAALFESIATSALAIGGILFFVSSMVKGDVANAIPMVTSGKGIVAVIIQVPAMFVGFDVIPQTVEESNVPMSKLGNIIIIAIIMAGVWYMMMILAISFAAPMDFRMQSLESAVGVPVADAFAYCMGSAVLGKCIIVVALCGILTSWNGFIIGAARLMFAMGRAKMLPEVFGKTHPKFGSPYAAVLLVGIVTFLSPLLGKNALSWFVDASSLGTVFAYLMVCISFIQVRKKEPNLDRPYKAPGTWVGYVATVISLFFIYLYTPIGPGALSAPCWAMVAFWIVLGVILYQMAKNTHKNVKASERELLIFGADVARKDYLEGKYD
jgi:APA family basic amino acid/polyamine antiporter